MRGAQDQLLGEDLYSLNNGEGRETVGVRKSERL